MEFSCAVGGHDHAGFYETVRKTIHHLWDQTVRRHLELVIVACLADALDHDEPEMERALQEVPQGLLRLRRGGDFLASFRADWRHVFDAIRDDTPVQCALEDGRRALQVVLAAAQSASWGRPVKVVEVSGS